MELSNPMKIFEEFEMRKLSDLVRKLTAEVDELEGGLSKEIMERYERVKKICGPRGSLHKGFLWVRCNKNNIFKKNMLFKNNILFVSRNIDKRRYNFGIFRRRDVCHLFVSFSLRLSKCNLEVTFETVSTLRHLKTR